METTIQTESLSTNGEGIARIDGKVTFVPFTLPGERWTIRLLEEKKNFNRATPIQQHFNTDALTIKRIDPQCPYFTRCGGCQLQHIAYEDQLDMKQQWLQETFRRIGHIEILPNPLIHAGEWQYRNKVTIPIIEFDGKLGLAYHRYDNPDEYIVIEDCLIASGTIRTALPPLRKALCECVPTILPYQKNRSHGGRVEILALENGLSIRLYDVLFDAKSLPALSYSLFQEIDQLQEIAVPLNRETLVIHRSGQQTKSEIEPSAFAQVNDAVREMMYAYTTGLPFTNPGRLFEGYCGSGEMTIRLSNRFQQIDAVEINSRSIRLANERLNEASNRPKIQFHCKPVEAYLAANKKKYDAILLNPPRAGLPKKVVEQTIAVNAPEIVMISCHPAALARDTAAFVQSGYRIQSIQPFDMFPQTYHLETVVHLSL